MISSYRRIGCRKAVSFFIRKTDLLIIQNMKSLSAFNKHLERKGLSKASIKTYVQAVIDYQKTYSTLSEKNVLLWRAGLDDRYKPASIATRIKGMNAYLYFNGSSLKLPPVKMQRIHHLENVISMADYHRLIRKMSECDDIITRRWMLLFKTIAMTGMRVSEVRQVRVEHIEEGKAQVYAKGGIYRIILIPKRLCKEIQQYLDNIEQSEGYIFGKTPEKPYAIGTIEAKLHEYGKQYHLPKAVCHPHALRHLFGKSFMQQKGADITVLADLLGHSSIETTRIYTRRSMEEQQAALERIVTW